MTFLPASGTCPTCGVPDMRLRVDDTLAPHGPPGNRCPGGPAVPDTVVRATKAEVDAVIAGHLAELTAVLAGTGGHAGHTREQVGRCVYCSCGTRVQGSATSPLAGRGSRGWQVRLVDGFVAYRGSESGCQEVAAKHAAATVERATA